MTTANANNWILDDGVMELMPEYTIQHIHGNAYSDVYAAFTFIPDKKLVRLRPSDSVTVNGHAFQGLQNAQGFYYQARIPTTVGSFTLAVSRAGRPAMSHTFQMPELGFNEVPKVYTPYEILRVPVNYVVPPDYVGSDRYDFSIFGSLLRFDLVSTTRKKDNKYVIDRLPDIQDGAIVFRHIIEKVPKAGVYKAKIFRQQRFVLNDMSSASRTGWANLSHSMDFMIEVK